MVVAGLMLAAAVPAQGPDANVRFDERFAAGRRALAAGKLLSASRAFSQCRELAGEVAPERRAVARFASELFLVETAVQGGQAQDVEVQRRVVELTAAAVESGAWTAAGVEGLRLRALVLRWQSNAAGFRTELPAADRDWLLRDDFFTAIPARRLRGFTAAAHLLRFQLAIGTAAELAMLRALMAVELGGSEWRDIVLTELAQYHAERRSLDRAQVFVERLPRDKSLGLRAWLALQREDHSQARALAERLVEQRHPQGHQLLAEALEAGGDPGRAVEHYGAALAIARSAAARAAARNGLGDCRLATGDLDGAEEAYRQVIDDDDAPAARSASSPDSDHDIGLVAELAETHKDLGRLYEARGNPHWAWVSYHSALEYGEAARSRLLADPFGGSWLQIHADQLTAIDGILRTSDDPGWEVVRALELGRGRAALDLLGRGATTLDVRELRELIRQRLLATDPATFARIGRELELMRTSIAAAAARLEVPPVSSLRAFGRRQRDRTILTWWLGREQAWLLVINGDAIEKFELGDSRTIRTAVASAWRTVAVPGGETTALATAADLLVPDAARGSLRSVVLAIVHPSMARLPLAALRFDDDAFGVKHALVQAPSLAVAQLLDRRDATGRGTVIVEAPEHTNLTQRLGLDPLVHTARECEGVRAAHPNAEHLRAAAATFASVRTRRPDLLHVAAHAIDCPGLPTQSLLLLADGPHAMGSLGELQLPGTFVVLSACAAATGEERGHEGVVGLIDGLFAAGARAAVAPVTSVNQQATADFMRVFHAELGKGAAPAFALQRARATLLATDNYRDPHYWGAFTLFGGPGQAGEPAARPRPEPRRALSPGWLLVVGLVLAAGYLLLPRQQRGVGLG
ncbi:MAG: CHAT domain-containing protein [bacterium]|nr:CHAT domain-containing protein [bacterium]